MWRSPLAPATLAGVWGNAIKLVVVLGTPTVHRCGSRLAVVQSGKDNTRSPHPTGFAQPTKRANQSARIRVICEVSSLLLAGNA